MGDDQLHFVLLPFMAQGHTIPMIDIAKLLASRSGTTVTLLLTPLNHIRVKPILSRSSQLGVHIQVEELHFPAEEVGLPAGCENVDALPSPSLIDKFCFAANMLRSQVETMLKKMMHAKQSCCLVADMCFIFAADVAQKLGIPRIFFNGMNCFASLCIHHIFTSNILDTVSSEFEYFDVPGMPGKIIFTGSQVKGIMATPKDKESREAMEKLMRNENSAYMVIFNTFQDLEHVYIRHYEKVRHGKIWSIGPLSMFDKELAHDNAIIRGKTSSVDVTQCLKWLDSWELGTVIYACLGSFTNLTVAQMLELGLGLEASGRPFIWVVGSGAGKIDLKELLQQLMARNGYEERVRSARRGLLIWGWAPQVQILSHQAVGGFLTHCGWNSSLEGISAGIPMVTWPLFGDQFYNEKFLVDILKIGVRVGVKRVMQFGKEEEIGVQVHGAEVKKAVEKLMDGGGEEGEARRRRVRELAEKAKKAVEEGGSSRINIENFIEDVRKFTAKKTCV